MANINNNFKALSLSTESEVLVSSKFRACSNVKKIKTAVFLIFSLLLFSTGLTRVSQAYEYTDWSSMHSYQASWARCSEYASISSQIASWYPDKVASFCSASRYLSSTLYYDKVSSYLSSSASPGDANRIGYCKNISYYCTSASCSGPFSSQSSVYTRYFQNGGYCDASWIRSAMAASASPGDWYNVENEMIMRDNFRYSFGNLDAQTVSSVASLCTSSYVYNGISGSWIDASGNSHYMNGNYYDSLCNGCPKDYLKGEDGRCHRTPQDCQIAAIDGNTTFCNQNGCGGQYFSATYDGFGGCASAGASLSSYSQNPSNAYCDVNTNYGGGYSYYPPFNGKGAAYSTYTDENGSTVEGIICADSGCPKGYAKTEDGRCKTLENTEGCNYVWAKGDRVYCGSCESGYGKTPFGECKPCNPGCKNGCSQNDYTSCNGGCKAGYTGNGCETCTGGKFYQDGECVSSCAEGYYQTGTKCVKNPDGCASYNYSTGSCSDCSGGSYLDGADCKANPKGCDSYNGTSCDVCSDGYYSDSGICKANPTGCTDYSGTYCYSCSSGYLEKDGACIPASNGCGAGYKDMGGFCNRVQWTPAEAAAVLTDDNNNSVTITFKK